MIISKDSDKLRQIASRDRGVNKEHLDTVSKIVNDVRTLGDEALFRYTRQFDGFDINLDNAVVEASEMKDCFDELDAPLREALLGAKENIVDYQTKAVEKSWLDFSDDGTVLGSKVTPLSRVGVYIPGGSATYFSSVLMNVVPAKVAGVEEIIGVTPAVNGEINRSVVAAAYIAGVTKLIKIGGAQAIAALAYSTETVPGVEKIVGPGNIYVALAKRMVFGDVGIDMIAGPSEIAVIADGSSPASFVAADMLSQAEHDELSSAIGITWDKSYAKRIEKEIYRQLQALPRKDIASKSIEDNGAIVLVKDLAEAIDVANSLAPEHLELMIKKPFDVLGQIRNAGAIFVGECSPEALGDYYAGPSHVLPTNGSAKFASPLSVRDFVKHSSVISYSKERFLRHMGDVMLMAEREGFEAHKNSVAIRCMKKGE